MNSYYNINEIEELININSQPKNFDCIFGLDKETEELIKGLSRHKKSNVLIIGKAGIGKTTLVENLAKKIKNNEVPKNLKNKKIYELSLNTTVAGTRYRGDFEEKVRNILEIVSKQKNIILFVDEIHNILNLGGAEGAMSLGETLKPFLARNKITLIGATTTKEYNKTIHRDSAFDRRFYKMKMKEPKTKDVIDILKSNKKEYEKHYSINLDDADIVRVVLKSKRRKGTFPDKAFDELEEYCYLLQKSKIDLKKYIKGVQNEY